MGEQFENLQCERYLYYPALNIFGGAYMNQENFTGAVRITLQLKIAAISTNLNAKNKYVLFQLQGV